MNNNKIPCDTVRDLFPSYIDKLTSDTTNQLIEEHIAGCATCSDILNTMRTPEAEPSASCNPSWDPTCSNLPAACKSHVQLRLFFNQTGINR